MFMKKRFSTYGREMDLPGPYNGGLKKRLKFLFWYCEINYFKSIWANMIWMKCFLTLKFSFSTKAQPVRCYKKKIPDTLFWYLDYRHQNSASKNISYLIDNLDTFLVTVRKFTSWATTPFWGNRFVKRFHFSWTPEFDDLHSLRRKRT